MVDEFLTKEYYLSRKFIGSGHEIRSICQSFDLDSPNLETEAEKNVFLALCDRSYSFPLGETSVHIGASTPTARSTTSWFWMNSKQRVTYQLNFLPNEPNFEFNDEYCLSIGRTIQHPLFAFKDVSCNGDIQQFLCEKIISKI